MNVFIYVLIKSDVVFYVGQTKNFEERKRAHRHRFGKDISMIEIDSCHCFHSVALEYYYIRKYLKEGHPLQNKRLPFEKAIKQKNVCVPKAKKPISEAKKLKFMNEFEAWLQNKQSKNQQLT